MEASPKKQNTATILKIVIGALCLAVLGMGAWLYLEKKDNKETEQVLTQDKNRLVQNLDSLRIEYASIKTNNDSINNALILEQEKIELLLEKVKKTEAGNLQKIRAYEQELGTLRAIMKNYIVQIDSLNTVNQQLMTENMQIKEKATEVTRKYEEVAQKTEQLTAIVQEGSEIKGRGLTVVGINTKGKETERASRTNLLKSCISLVENAIAERGAKTVYIRVKGPDGIVITTSEDNLFNFNGEQIAFSAARQIDYQGGEVDVCVYYDFGDSRITKGVYEVTAYLNGKAIGVAQTRLK